MRYGLAFRYFVGPPGGFLNTILLTICLLIPILGPIVAGGYRSLVATELIHDPDMQRHPKFDFDRFVEYLTRGIWPFLIGLLLALPILLVVVIAIPVGFAIGAAVNIPGAGFIAMACLALTGSILMGMLSVPMTLHAELVNRYDFGGGFRFAMNFWTLVPGPAIRAGLTFIPLAMVVSILGLLCCFVGIYPASTIIQMAGQHLVVQLYREYLERGGEPIAEYENRAPRNRADRREVGDRD